MKIEDFVKKAFAGMTDKAGKPYVEHCYFVAELAKKTGKMLGISDAKCEWLWQAGLLHDVIEDTSYNKEYLLGFIRPYVVDIVETVTHKRSESYDEYFDRIMKNRFAMIVKYADMTHNMDMSQFPEDERDSERNVKRIKEKYVPRYAMICKELGME